MTNKKLILIIGGIAAISVLAGIGYGLVSRDSNKPKSLTLNKTSQTSSSSQLQDLTDSQAIPLNQSNNAENESDSGLSVDTNSQNSGLGQIYGQQTPDTSGSSDSSSAEKMLDPSTFGQYDQYKNDDSALFAELQQGTGDELKAGKKAAVYYKGWLTNGQLFDMSRTNDKGELQPFVFTMGAHEVIQGWEQSLAGMKVGGVRFVIVPPAAGYGPSGQGSIPGNSVLIFQVQLAAVQ